VTKEEDFDRVMRSSYAKDLPPVEVVTDQFRAVARNFLTLPLKLLLALKEAQIAQDGTDTFLLMDACELAFKEEDFEKLQSLSIQDFLNVVHAWTTWKEDPDAP
jgi:hypothetical protein